MKKKYITNIPPKKSLGQNFLSNPRIISRIIEAGHLNQTDVVLEVGPGRGDLTKQLSEAAGKVIAVEKDHRLIEELKNKFHDQKNITIVEDDILEFETASHALSDDSFKIIANLPYYITSHFLRTVLESWPRPQILVLMVQKEVARRMTAVPPDMNLLALSVQLYADIAKVVEVSKNNFRPRPKVDSTVVAITPRPDISREKVSKIMTIAKAGFAHKRKRLMSNLADGLAIEKDKITEVFEALNLNRDIRSENLSKEQWQQLANLLQW